jgi:hypothetical protein
LNLKWRQSKVSINQSSFPWSNQAANFRKRTLRAIRTLPSQTRKSLSSLMILIGQIEKQFFAFFSQRWTLENRRAVGVTLNSPLVALRRFVVVAKTLMKLSNKMKKNLRLGRTSNSCTVKNKTWMIRISTRATATRTIEFKQTNILKSNNFLFNL